MKDSSTDNRYCAFLRGVNVKGTNMKMAEVCSVFEKAGMREVSSVLASGNILFSSDGEGEALKKLLETAMSVHFSYQAFLFLKNRQQLEKMFRDNPFAVDPSYQIYSFVGMEGMGPILLSEFEKCQKTSGEEGRLIGPDFYWKVPKGSTLDSEFGKILGRKNLKDSFTSRNINTIGKVLKKL